MFIPHLVSPARPVSLHLEKENVILRDKETCPVNEINCPSSDKGSSTVRYVPERFGINPRRTGEWRRTCRGCRGYVGRVSLSGIRLKGNVDGGRCKLRIACRIPVPTFPALACQLGPCRFCFVCACVGLLPRAYKNDPSKNVFRYADPKSTHSCPNIGPGYVMRRKLRSSTQSVRWRRQRREEMRCLVLLGLARPHPSSPLLPRVPDAEASPPPNESPAPAGAPTRAIQARPHGPSILEAHPDSAMAAGNVNSCQRVHHRRDDSAASSGRG